MCYWNYFILKCCFNLIYSVMAWVENQPQLIRGRKGGHSIQSRFKFSPIRGSPSPFSQCPFYSQYTNHANQNHYEPVLNILWLYFLWLFAIFLLVPRHSFRSVFIPLGIHSASLISFKSNFINIKSTDNDNVCLMIFIQYVLRNLHIFRLIINMRNIKTNNMITN